MTRRLIGPTGMQRRGWLHFRAALVAVVLLMVSLGATDAPLADTVPPTVTVQCVNLEATAERDRERLTNALENPGTIVPFYVLFCIGNRVGLERFG